MRLNPANKTKQKPGVKIKKAEPRKYKALMGACLPPGFMISELGFSGARPKFNLQVNLQAVDFKEGGY